MRLNLVSCWIYIRSLHINYRCIPLFGSPDSVCSSLGHRIVAGYCWLHTKRKCHSPIAMPDWEYDVGLRIFCIGWSLAWTSWEISAKLQPVEVFENADLLYSGSKYSLHRFLIRKLKSGIVRDCVPRFDCWKCFQMQTDCRKLSGCFDRQE